MSELTESSILEPSVMDTTSVQLPTKTTENTNNDEETDVVINDTYVDNDRDFQREKEEYEKVINSYKHNKHYLENEYRNICFELNKHKTFDEKLKSNQEEFKKCIEYQTELLLSNNEENRAKVEKHVSMVFGGIVVTSVIGGVAYGLYNFFGGK